VDATPERVVGGRYQLLEVIGRGGMGVVWTARDQLLDRVVAVKQVIPPAHLDEDERRLVQQRSLREARAAAGLASVAAVTVHDVVDEAGHSWIVMERLEAPSLAEVLRDLGPLSVDETTAIGLALLDALQMAHAAGVLHRDVKPGNVMLTRRGAVLTDFGIAHRDGDPGITTSGLVLGSPAYLAPERARGDSAGPEADLWGLGATLYAAVEGRGPFDREGQMATLHAVVSADPPPPVRAGALAPLLLRLLTKDPTGRPSIEQTREGLGRVSGGQPAGGATAELQPSPGGPANPVGLEPQWAEPPAEPGALPAPAAARPRGRRRTGAVVTGLVLVLAVALALVVLLPGLDGVGGLGSTEEPGDDPTEASAPAPFESAALYEFARYLFDAEECFAPGEDEFPVAQIEPDAELVKCQDLPYSATFWCKSDTEALRDERALLLGLAEPGTERDISDPPAGQDDPVDGVQVAFRYSGTNNSRVYWDSPEAMCGAELQSRSNNVDRTVRYWLSGQPS